MHNQLKLCCIVLNVSADWSREDNNPFDITFQGDLIPAKESKTPWETKCAETQTTEASCIYHSSPNTFPMQQETTETKHMPSLSHPLIHTNIPLKHQSTLLPVCKFQYLTIWISIYCYLHFMLHTFSLHLHSSHFFIPEAFKPKLISYFINFPLKVQFVIQSQLTCIA